MGRWWATVTRHQPGPEDPEQKRRREGSREKLEPEAQPRGSQPSLASVRGSENCAEGRQGHRDHCSRDPTFTHCGEDELGHLPVWNTLHHSRDTQESLTLSPRCTWTNRSAYEIRWPMLMTPNPVRDGEKAQLWA